MAKDLVCGMKIDKRKDLKAKYEGKDYYFCSPKCKKVFESNPEQYLCAKCGKECHLEKTLYKIKHKSKIYCFCSEKHKKKFQLEHFGEVIY